MDDPERASAGGQELDQLPHVEQDINQPEVTDDSNRQNPWKLIAQHTFRHEELHRALERPQLTGITLSSSQSPPYSNSFFRNCIFRDSGHGNLDQLRATNKHLGFGRLRARIYRVSLHCYCCHA
jgi:hypothetical protein